MTREQQKAIREWKKAETVLTKKYAKLYNLKKKDYAVWQEKDNMFYWLFLYVGATIDGNVCLSSTVYYKPLWLDDIFWRIMGMESNIQEPKSLRAVGAFSLRGVEYKKESFCPDNPCIEELEKLIRQEVEAFVDIPAILSVNDYLKNTRSELYHGDIMLVINEIHNKNYSNAKRLLSEKRITSFYNEGEDFNSRAIKYIDVIAEDSAKQI